MKILPSNPWASTIREITRQKLSDFEWDVRAKRYKVNKRYLWYDDRLKRLYFPVNVAPFIKDSLENIGAPFTVKNEHIVKPRKITVKMQSWFKPRDKQIPVMKYLTALKPYRKGLATATGSGKTVSSIYSIVSAGEVGMIICSGLTNQWVRSIFQFTDAKPEDVYEIKGFSSLFDLLASELKPSFIIWSLETLRLYVQRVGNYAELPPFEKFLEYFGVGIVLRDEVHLNFHAVTMIDLHMNVKNNYYLTATFISSNPSTRKVFNLIYPYGMQFNPDKQQKYISGTAVMYYGNVPEKKCLRQRGYMHVKYEDYLLKRPKLLADYFQRVVQPIVHSYYINKAEEGEKLLIYFATLEMIDYMQKQLQAVYPDYKVIKFVGGVKDEAMVTADIGVTNTKRSGTGCDVKKLRTVINTVSLRAPALVEQLRGRLRKLESGNTPEYVETVDKSLRSQMRHYQDRRYAHEKACIKFEEIQW